MKKVPTNVNVSHFIDQMALLAECLKEEQYSALVEQGTIEKMEQIVASHNFSNCYFSIFDELLCSVEGIAEGLMVISYGEFVDLDDDDNEVIGKEVIEFINELFKEEATEDEIHNIAEEYLNCWYVEDDTSYFAMFYALQG